MSPMYANICMVREALLTSSLCSSSFHSNIGKSVIQSISWAACYCHHHKQSMRTKLLLKPCSSTQCCDRKCYEIAEKASIITLSSCQTKRHNNKGCGHKWWWIAAIALLNSKQSPSSISMPYPTASWTKHKSYVYSCILQQCWHQLMPYPREGRKVSEDKTNSLSKKHDGKISDLINKTQLFCKISSHGIKCPIHSSGQACSKQNDIPWTGTTSCC